MSASVTPRGAAKSISATHIGRASGALMPDSLAMLSHLAECVPRRSMTRSKSNMRQSLHSRLDDPLALGLLAEQREQQMVLPFAVDPKEALGEPLLAKPGAA